MSFEIEVKNSEDLIKVNPVVEACIKNGVSQQLYAATDPDQSQQYDAFRVSHYPLTRGKLDTLVSFGVDPTNATEQQRGVGIYSVPYCLTKAVIGNADWVDG